MLFKRKQFLTVIKIDAWTEDVATREAFPVDQGLRSYDHFPARLLEAWPETLVFKSTSIRGLMFAYCDKCDLLVTQFGMQWILQAWHHSRRKIYLKSRRNFSFFAAVLAAICMRLTTAAAKASCQRVRLLPKKRLFRIPRCTRRAMLCSITVRSR